MVIDDPIRNRETAESPVYQQKIVDWAKSTAFTRLSVKGSIIINMARWSDGDLIGRLLDEGGRWEHLNLPAILDEDLSTERSLWEAGRPLWWLKEQRRELGPYQWSSLYEGKPQPRGGALFREPSRYRFAEVVGARFAIACDPAASAKTSADHSAIVVVAAVGDGIDQKVYVLETWRGQVEIPHLVHQLKVMQERWRCPVYVESAGGFKAVAQVLRQIGGSSRTQSDDPLRIVEVPPRGDKFTRALPVAAAWNDGRVLLPATPEPWLPDFLAEVTRFTGKGDRQDDQVDALSHAFTAVDRRVSAVKRGPQSMRY